MQCTSNNFGFSVMELMISMAVGTIVIGGGLFAVSHVYTAVNKATVTHKVESQVYELIQAIVQNGRLAQRCAKEPADLAAPGVSLRCVLDRGDGNPKYIRYKKLDAGNVITFETSDTIVNAADSNVIVWTVATTYGGPDTFKINSFSICNDTEMAAGTCALLPATLNTFFSAACDTGGASSDQRCFRFGLVAEEHSQSMKSMEFQTAFFVRTPAPNGINYVWGSKQ